MTLKKLFSVHSPDGGVFNTSVNLDHVVKVMSGYRSKNLQGERVFHCAVELVTREVLEAPTEAAAREMYYALFNEPADSGRTQDAFATEPPPAAKPISAFNDERFLRQV